MTREPASTHWLDALTVYGTALLVGLTMVSFPASSTLLKEIKGLSNAQYGFIFIPQIFTAIFGAITGGSLARHIGLKKILGSTLIANALAQLSLFTAVMYFSDQYTFYLVLLATALFGLAFGLSAAPLNTYPQLIFPAKGETALVALHTVLGTGLAAGPFIVGWLSNLGWWFIYPISLVGVSILVVLFLPFCHLPDYVASLKNIDVKHTKNLKTPLYNWILWVFLIIVVMYAFAEGTFSNWAVVYLNENRGIPLTTASLALSAFWAMIAIGRLLVSVLLIKVSSQSIWLFLPVLMIAAFFMMPFATNGLAGILLFSLAGLACSAFFPLSVDLVTKQFPVHAALVSSIMMAALMTGVGIGSYTIGSLRSLFPMENLYQISAVYPALVLLFITILKIKSKK
ncbi:MAG: MFS transporter [Calditrichia bacterium]|nr:MFS transporter [Calditrichia bacterium]